LRRTAVDGGEADRDRQHSGKLPRIETLVEQEKPEQDRG